MGVGVGWGRQTDRDRKPQLDLSLLPTVALIHTKLLPYVLGHVPDSGMSLGPHSLQETDSGRAAAGLGPLTWGLRTLAHRKRCV